MVFFSSSIEFRFPVGSILKTLSPILILPPGVIILRRCKIPASSEGERPSSESFAFENSI